MKRGFGLLVLSVSVLTLFVAQIAHAERFTSSGYIIDASEVGNSFGGDSSDADYQLTSSGGESVIGQGSGGSYTLDGGYVAQLQNSMQLSVQPNGLELYYQFDEASGSFVRDTSSNEYNGTTVASPSWATGRVDGAVSLNGTSHYVTGTDLDIAGTITVSAWVYPTSTQSSTVLSKRSSTSDSQAAFTLASSVPTAQMTIGGASESITDTGNALPTNTWSYLSMTYDGSNFVFYVDGVVVNSSAASGAISTNNYVWTLGRNASAGSGYFGGRIDETKVLSRALTANEVKAEYDAGVAGNTAGLSFATDIVPGVSQTSNYDAIVLTDAVNGYTLSVSQDQNLTSGGYTIPAVSGTIASPSAWTEGVTKGLGFTLYGTNASAIDAKWSSGAAYAAFPGTTTSYYTRTGAQSAKDVLNMRLRLDVASTQQAAAYSNVVTTTGTLSP